jgi:hypothetical protein
MLKHFAFLAALACASAFAAETWPGLSADGHCGGSKVGEDNLIDKVVLVYEWDASIDDCVAYLPRMQQIWSSFSSKPFVLLGSVQGKAADAKRAIAAKKVTFPNYESCGYERNYTTGVKLPYFYVVNHSGRIVYSGTGERDATEAVVTWITRVGQPDSLTGDFVFGMKCKYKAMEKSLVLGKPIKSQLKTLEADAKKGQSKAATPQMRAAAADARALLKEIEAAKRAIKRTIELKKRFNPAAALRLIKDFSVTFPDEGAAYKDEIRLLEERAKATTGK